MLNDPDRLVTIQAAAAELGVTTARVHQLIKDGREGKSRCLTGTAYVGRAPKDEKRVSWSSVLTEKQLRAEEAQRRTEALRQPRKRAKSSQGVPPVADSFRTAALAMKVALDAARDELRDKQGSTGQALEKLLLDAARFIDEQAAHFRALDEIGNGYANALTELLVPDTNS